MSDDTNKELEIFHVIRRVWVDDEWYYSLVDVVRVLANTAQPSSYWIKVRNRLRDEEGFDLSLIKSIRMVQSQGRLRNVDSANRETILRIIQSIPSPHVEFFKRWLASVGTEKLTEIENPEKVLNEIRAKYRSQGYSDDWVDKRIENLAIHNALTDEWRERGVANDREFAILTNEISKGTFSLTVVEYKEFKDLSAKHNLRDHMDHIELGLCSLSEGVAIRLHQDHDSQGFTALRKDAREAGEIGAELREVLERRLNGPVVSPKNFLKQISDHKKRDSGQLLLFSDEEEV